MTPESYPRRAGRFRWQDALTGLLIYGTGDGVASLMLGSWSLSRLLGIMFIGATLYAFEIPNYFRWIDRKTPEGMPALRRMFWRTLLAFLYFNPLWIARHLLFISLFSGRMEEIVWGLLWTGLFAFLAKIPISLLGNYVIQMHVPLRWRFAASAAFSGLLAVYYAFSAVWFHA